MTVTALSQLRGTPLRVPTRRITIFWGLYLSFPIFENNLIEGLYRHEKGFTGLELRNSFLVWEFPEVRVAFLGSRQSRDHSPLSIRNVGKRV